MGARAAGREATVRSKLRTYAPTIFYGDSHDGNDGSRGSHDTTRNTRTYTLPTFAEATDASEAMRERRADRNKSIAMRVLAAVLILTALGIGMFPRVLQYRSARELASTSRVPKSAWRAGHTRRPMRRSPRPGSTTSDLPSRGSR